MSAAHADDLELARLCAAGDEQAWERFILQYRPLLYRAADALDPSGGAREIADALYGELYGIQEGSGGRRSLFRYFQGRSSLATWLRSVLAQRYVDRLRAAKRLLPLPDDERALPRLDDALPLDPNRSRHTALVRQALSCAIGKLSPRARLRLGCYYLEQLTLAETGRVLHEHEATASRQLARTRQVLREDVERQLRDAGLNDDQIVECLQSAAEDPGPLDLKQVFGAASGRKEPRPDRSL